MNFDLPTDNETYVHRIGRTARAGAKGVAISFVTPGEKRRLQQLQKKLKIQMNEVFAPGNEDLNTLRRKEIWAELETRLPAPKDMETWLKALKKEFDVSTKDIALAALTLLSEERTIPIEEVTADKPKRGEPRGKLSKEQRVALNEAEIHLTIGRRAGIQIGDIVGAIANETGISGNQIGRISLLDRSTFVGLPKELADRIVSDHPELTVRGAPTKVSLAQGSGHKPKGDFPRKRRDAKSRFKKGPKFRGQNKRANGRKSPGKRNKRS